MSPEIITSKRRRVRWSLT